MAVQIPYFPMNQNQTKQNQTKQNQSQPATAITVPFEEKQNAADQNDFARNMQFLAMVGNMAGQLDPQTLAGMMTGFALLKPIQKLFDRDKKKKADGANSMDVGAIVENYTGTPKQTEYVLNGGDFYKPEVLDQPQPQGNFDSSQNKLLGDPEKVFYRLKSTIPQSEDSLLKQWNGGKWW